MSWHVLLVFSALCASFVDSADKAPAIGPCVLGTHSESLKLNCTANGIEPATFCLQDRRSATDKEGYFELVQCFDDRCICVDPTTGHEATETVTDSPKVAPQCGMCHKKLAFLFFAPPPPNDVPQCHPKTGNFLSMQCLQSKNECFCVNTETGQEILGSRGQKGSVKCADVDFSIDSGKGISVNTDRKPLAGHPVANEFCKLPKSIGSSCSGKPKRIQYYFDYETFECLAFQYQGCGGNANRYDTVDECWSKCKLPDFGTCSGNVGPFLEADGNPRICHSSEPGAAAKTCPPAYTCTMFAFMGLCCDKATQDMYLRNYRPTCPEGQKAHRVDLNGMPWTLIGKSCADNFCPSGSVCNKLEVFAHCCTPRRAARSVEKTPNSISTDEGIPNEITVEESLPELPTSDPVRKPPVCSDGPIRYYFEKSIATCVAYRSCWGNVTGWSSAQSCNMRRLPMDIGPCSTWRTALYNFDAIPTNPSIICDGPEGKKDCPKGYSCRRGAFFAVCCNDEVEEMWSRNLHPVCRNGDQKLVKDNDANPLLGHRCEDKFCPENSSCVQQEHLAHCCLR